MSETNSISYGYEVSWRPKPSDVIMISGSGFATFEACREARENAMLAFGYRAPRWFEWWRWFTHR